MLSIIASIILVVVLSALLVILLLLLQQESVHMNISGNIGTSFIIVVWGVDAAAVKQ